MSICIILSSEDLWYFNIIKLFLFQIWNSIEKLEWDKYNCYVKFYLVYNIIYWFQCGKHHIPYIIYKSGWCAWWLGFLTYYLITYESGIKFAVYQTHWNLILQCLGSILQLCSAVHAWRWYKPSDEKNTPLLYKLNWVVFTVSSVFAFLVTLVYWTVLYKGTYVLMLSPLHQLLKLISLFGLFKKLSQNWIFFVSVRKL